MYLDHWNNSSIMGSFTNTCQSWMLYICTNPRAADTIPRPVVFQDFANDGGNFIARLYPRCGPSLKRGSEGKIESHRVSPRHHAGKSLRERSGRIRVVARDGACSRRYCRDGCRQSGWVGDVRRRHSYGRVAGAPGCDGSRFKLARRTG